MRVLITGFEPFANSPVNPSAQIVDELTREPIHDVDLVTAVLPVAARRLPRRLLTLLHKARPDVVLCLGEARGAPRMYVERVAVNLLDYEGPDNDGLVLHDEPIVPGGPAAYWATLPSRAIRDAVRRSGLACELSMSAGCYMCNQAMYLALDWAARAEALAPPRVGFLHVPSLPGQRGVGAEGAMELERQVAGVRAAIGACVEARA
jgi:pyroglutamyl-peptidase